jgi:hypothetical protein
MMPGVVVAVYQSTPEIGAEIGGKTGQFPDGGKRGNRSSTPGNHSGSWRPLALSGRCGNLSIGKSGHARIDSA